MVSSIFQDYLIKTHSSLQNIKNSFKCLLDKNEQATDIDIEFKEEVVNELLNTHWNRYPDKDYSDIEEKIAEYCQLEKSNVLLCPGSASIITTLLNYFAINKKEIIITQPTYSLFDHHCKTYHINYTPWYLSEDLEYDYDNLPRLNENSVFIITSPNNPVGNCFDKSFLVYLLKLYPKSLIIVDAVYTEFSKQNLSSLIKEYSNLILLRSFSKAFPIAGLRLGYLCASSNILPLLRTLFLQFSISSFSLIFARKLLFNEGFLEYSKAKVKSIIREREILTDKIKSSFDRTQVQVFPSQGNFLLLRVHNKTQHENVLNQLLSDGIKILDTKDFPLLENTIRVSIGENKENHLFFRSLMLGMNSLKTQSNPKGIYELHSN